MMNPGIKRNSRRDLMSRSFVVSLTVGHLSLADPRGDRKVCPTGSNLILSCSLWGK